MSQQQPIDLLRIVHEKVDQYAEEADRIHDAIRNLETQIGKSGKQVEVISGVAVLIEKRIDAALEIDQKIDTLANAVAEKAMQESLSGVWQALQKMNKSIADVTEEAKTTSIQARNRLLLSNTWVIFCCVLFVAGLFGGGYLMHYVDSSRFITDEQLAETQVGQRFQAIWSRATDKERDEILRIERKAQPRQ